MTYFDILLNNRTGVQLAGYPYDSKEMPPLHPVVCSSAYTIIFILKNDTQEQKYCSFEISRKLRQCLEVMSVRKLFPKVGHDKNHKKSQENYSH